MKDFNFFEPYLTKKNDLSRKQIILYASTSILIILVFVIPIINQLMIKRMEEKSRNVSAMVNSEEIQGEIEEINNKRKQIKDLENYYETLEIINNDIIKIDIINDVFLQTITDRVPEEVFFQKININQGLVEITGIAKNNIFIAEFEENLREFPYFKNIFISNISADSDGYTFVISFQIKGGGSHETD